MADNDVEETPVETPAPAKESKKAPKSPKSPKAKATSTHPKYSEMIANAISALKERSGSSRQAIVKHIVATYKIDEKTATTQVKLALKRGVQGGSLKQVKGTGASGSFKLNKDEDKPTTPKKSPAKKPAAKKAKKPAAEKKSKSPAKSAAKKSPAKPKTAKKSPAKPKAAKKSPAKKPAAKKTVKAKKPAAKK